MILETGASRTSSAFSGVHSRGVGESDEEGVVPRMRLRRKEAMLYREGKGYVQ